jgi:adenylosuccinate lyase
MLQNYQRIHTILIDFSQDMWRYISDEWFIQEVKKGEVGSSTMPQKVNPIDFENSEGNLGLANALSEYLSRKLAISRLQRDLSDSTTVRNLGSVLGYSLVGYTSLLTGLNRVRPNEEKIKQDINKDWAILGEGVQTLLRKAHVEDPYSLIASLTRGQRVTAERWKEWIDELAIPENLKKQLHTLTPEKYIGLAEKLTKKAIAEIKKSKKSNS